MPTGRRRRAKIVAGLAGPRNGTQIGSERRRWPGCGADGEIDDGCVGRGGCAAAPADGETTDSWPSLRRGFRLAVYRFLAGGQRRCVPRPPPSFDSGRGSVVVVAAAAAAAADCVDCTVAVADVVASESCLSGRVLLNCMYLG